jgi:microcin C transport system substrate-binding protein
VTKPTLEPPLGSKRLQDRPSSPAPEIIWTRVPDYWAANIAVNIGRNNFDGGIPTSLTTAQRQAFTKGGYQDIRVENQSRRWATQYNFPAFQAGDVIKRRFLIHPARRCWLS